VTRDGCTIRTRDSTSGVVGDSQPAAIVVSLMFTHCAQVLVRASAPLEQHALDMGGGDDADLRRNALTGLGQVGLCLALASN
jgi:hypothetical protein